MGRFELRRVPFFSAHRSVYGPVERGLCGFCLCLSSGVDKRRAVLLPVLLSVYGGCIGGPGSFLV